MLHVASATSVGTFHVWVTQPTYWKVSTLPASASMVYEPSSAVVTPAIDWVTTVAPSSGSPSSAVVTTPLTVTLLTV